VNRSNCEEAIQVNNVWRAADVLALGCWRSRDCCVCVRKQNTRTMMMVMMMTTLSTTIHTTVQQDDDAEKTNDRTREFCLYLVSPTIKKVEDDRKSLDSVQTSSKVSRIEVMT
jgi:hypothetical protein